MVHGTASTRESIEPAGQIPRNPALPTSHPFSGVQSSGYWSSTTYANGPYSAWFVALVNGRLGNDGVKGNGHYVWPVRGEQ